MKKPWKGHRRSFVVRYRYPGGRPRHERVTASDAKKARDKFFSRHWYRSLFATVLGISATVEGKGEKARDWDRTVGKVGSTKRPRPFWLPGDLRRL